MVSKQRKASIINLLFTISVLFLTNGCSSNNANELSGYVEGEFMYIASPFQGRLSQLKVDRGQPIKAGAKLFLLEQEPEIADDQQAKQQLVQAEAGEKLAAQRLARFRRLHARGTIDQDTLDAAISHYQQQRANAAASRAIVTKASWSIAQKMITAPVTGTIEDTYFQAGELVPAGQPVLAILPENKVNIVFFVPETMLQRIKLGNQIQVQTDGSPSYQATITYIAAQAEYTPPVIYSRSNNYKLVYRVKAAPDIASAKLHPGQPVYIALP